jgi:hypothetical protein
MKVVTVLEQEDYDAMHDVIMEALNMDVSPTKEAIDYMWEHMPEDVKGTAIQWGCNDTVFRDNLYEWLQEEAKKEGLNN